MTSARATRDSLPHPPQSVPGRSALRRQERPLRRPRPARHGERRRAPRARRCRARAGGRSWARAMTIAPSIDAISSVASERARAPGTPRLANASASTSSQRAKTLAAAVGSRPPSSVAATIVQPAAQSLRPRTSVQCSPRPGSRRPDRPARTRRRCRPRSPRRPAGSLPRPAPSCRRGSGGRSSSAARRCGRARLRTTCPGRPARGTGRSALLTGVGLAGHDRADSRGPRGRAVLCHRVVWRPGEWVGRPACRPIRTRPRLR